MKRCFACFLIAVLCFLAISIPAFAEKEDWEEMPIITDFYEIAKGKVILEWEGKASLYQVNVDGKVASTVNIASAVLDLKEGSHQITVVPISYISREADTSISISLGEIAGIGSIDGSIDLASFGIEPKDLLQGTASKTFKVNYSSDPLMSAVPQIVDAYTDFDGRVSLSFLDKYDADVYKITIKSGKDVNYIMVDSSAESDAQLVFKTNANVTIVLDQDYLKSHRCMIPELDQKYSFSVTLGKRPLNLVDGTVESDSLIESKDSKAFDYTPTAAWKNAPVISYASQTADGTITLQWEHDDNGLGCQYKILALDKVLGVKKGEKVVGTTAENELVIHDLMNGKYIYVVIPVLAGEEGLTSEEVLVELKNDWVIAPTLEVQPGNNGQVLLTWDSPESVESYHITVYAGNGSLLKYINLDFSKYQEFDVTAVPGNMQYTYTYGESIDPETGVRLKFEIYGVRHTASGAEQKSATTSQIVSVS